MQKRILEKNNRQVLEMTTAELVIKNIRDALDLMADAFQQGIERIVLYEHHLHPDFYELRTGFAGEMLQKYSNYCMKLAIIGDFKKYPSQSLQAFMAESNRGNQVYFVADIETALSCLSRE